MNLISRFCSLVVTLSCVSCSGLWTSAEKEALVPVAVLPATLEKDFYRDPQKMSERAASTAGYASGLAGGLIGGAVAAVVVTGLENDYQNKNKAQFDALESRVLSASIGQEMQTALSRELTAIPHFKGKIKASAGTQFKVTIFRLTFARLSGDSPDHSMVCEAEFTCESASGETLFSEYYYSYGSELEPAPAQATLSSYVSDPELLKRHFRMIATDLCTQCGYDIKDSLGMEEP